nr:MAG TPA: hypothetical protein [Caudoviricetes sp.]
MHSESKQTKRKKQSANRKMRNHFNSYFLFLICFFIKITFLITY